MRQSNLAIKAYIDDQRDAIVHLYEQGLNIREIATQFAVSTTPIRRILHESGIQLRSGPEVLAEKGAPRGSASKKWRGGRFVGKSGYVYVYAPDHPCLPKGRLYMREHRIIMEQHLGRYLAANEHVHHIDGNRANNTIENLKLVTRCQHGKIHNPRKRQVYHCENCGSPIARTPSQVTNHVFCSQACCHAILTPYIAQKRWADKGHGKIVIHCEYCGTPLGRWPSQISKHNFCSNKCRGAASQGLPHGTFSTSGR